ncbi:hypothetical protein GCM10029964_107180 [Kibdelosporangium lantanae]
MSGPPPAPRAHWLLLSVLLLAVAALLTLHTLLVGGFHADGDTAAGPDGTVPARIRSGGAVLDTRGSTAVRARDRTVALTFDDGPDPEWTPKVLAVLDEYHVHATFFVTGANAARYPDLVREILRRGHEVGNHTTTHADVRDLGATATTMELRGTDLALAGAAGVTTSLFRPPYSATPASVDDLAWRADQAVGATGRLVVLSDVDSEDWRRPGSTRSSATPRHRTTAVWCCSCTTRAGTAPRPSPRWTGSCPRCGRVGGSSGRWARRSGSPR